MGCEISREQLIIERKSRKFRAHGVKKYMIYYTCHVRLVDVSLGSFGALSKISVVTVLIVFSITIMKHSVNVHGSLVSQLALHFNLENHLYRRLYILYKAYSSPHNKLYTMRYPDTNR